MLPWIANVGGLTRTMGQHTRYESLFEQATAFAKKAPGHCVDDTHPGCMDECSRSRGASQPIDPLRGPRSWLGSHGPCCRVAESHLG
jgi:hypothetical protein